MIVMLLKLVHINMKSIFCHIYKLHYISYSSTFACMVIMIIDECAIFDNNSWKKSCWMVYVIHAYILGLVQERRNAIAFAMKLRLPCTNPSIHHVS